MYHHNMDIQRFTINMLTKKAARLRFKYLCYLNCFLETSFDRKKTGLVLEGQEKKAGTPILLRA